MPALFARLHGRIQQTIERAIVMELDTAITSRMRWKKVANCSEAIGHILICVAMISAFLASSYESQEVTIVSGCTNVVSLAFVRFSRYAADEAAEREEIINKIIKQQTTESGEHVDENESQTELQPVPSLASLSTATETSS